MVGGDLHGPVEQSPTLTGENQGMGPPVGEAGSPLEHATPFELVDERDHATRGDLHGLPERLLGLALRRGDVAQQHDVAGVHAEGSQAVLPQAGRVKAQLGQQEGDSRDPQAGRRGRGGRAATGAEVA